MLNTTWTPIVELPLTPMDAVRLASFGIAYAPRYGHLMVDPAYPHTFCVQEIPSGALHYLTASPLNGHT